jgi:hypothetical protein
VLRPGGVFCMIEHNPYNPVTRLIVSRTPVDQNAVLLTGREASSLISASGFAADACPYFLYLPQGLGAIRRLESLLFRIPAGGQFALFGRKI